MNCPNLTETNLLDVLEKNLFLGGTDHFFVPPEKPLERTQLLLDNRACNENYWIKLPDFLFGW